MRSTKLLLALGACAALSACTTANVNLEDRTAFPDPSFDYHVGFDGMTDYDGNLLDARILGDGSGNGSIASVDLGPLAGVSVGLAGFNVRVLPLELGLGIGWYRSAPAADDGGDAAE